MCGIVGYLDLKGNAVPEGVLKTMTEAIVHRGPDGEGHWCEGAIGFGHRRLSIIDLSSAGHQPMISQCKNYVLTYNGEVYNFREIRKELEQKGYMFTSQTDSEVVLNALIEWGERAISRFNGMFSFAFWDKTNRKLVLARDRYGIKPLYYDSSGSRLLFGSEQKVIWSVPGFKRHVDKSALIEYFTFQNILTDKTFERDIKIFPAGNYAVLNMNDRSPCLKFSKYWDFNFRDENTGISDDEYREELDYLFRQAVNRQLVTDVELGSYLSGGMDSGSITAICSQKYPYVKTFTCGFDLNSASGLELAFDERVYAEMMSYYFKTEHYEMVLKSGDMERCLASLVAHMEEPRVGQSYPNFYASKLASKFVKVVLSGAGGDELFGGYPWRYYRAAVNDNFDDYIDKYYLFWQRLVANKELHKVFSPIQKDVRSVWTRDIFADVYSNEISKISTPEEYVNHSLYFEAKTFLHGLLVVEDKLSMAHSMETRVPFLDNDLVDFALRCPVRLKLKNLKSVIKLNENDAGNKTQTYFKKTNDGKQILRDAMKKYIPNKIIQAKKQGFSAPDASWFKGESINFVRDKLLDKNAPIYAYMSYEETSKLLDEHLSGQKNRRLFIWSLLYFEEYLSSHFSS